MSLLSRRELPAWCAPPEDAGEWCSFFFGSGEEVREFAFTMRPAGVVFEAEFLHAPTGSHEVEKGTYAIPGEVLIAAGVEALRRLEKGAGS